MCRGIMGQRGSDMNGRRPVHRQSVGTKAQVMMSRWLTGQRKTCHDFEMRSAPEPGLEPGSSITPGLGRRGEKCAKAGHSQHGEGPVISDASRSEVRRSMYVCVYGSVQCVAVPWGIFQRWLVSKLKMFGAGPCMVLPSNQHGSEKE